MLTTTLTRKLVSDEVSPRRAASVTERNLVVMRTSSYWWLVLSGLVEPVLYLFAIGWGVGALVGDMTLPDGRTVSYLVFLAPAMIAAAAMNGSVAETAMNFFAKLKFSKLYKSVLNTPVTPMEIAFGELGWATMRGGMYTVAFLVIMVAMGLTTPWLALLALPAALLVGIVFGAIGMVFATLMRSWQDFDYVGGVLFTMFLFSGTFVPVATYPIALQAVVQLTPLYHSVALLRGITVDALSWGLLWHVAYLLVLTLLMLAVAGRRVGRMLLK